MLVKEFSTVDNFKVGRVIRVKTTGDHNTLAIITKVKTYKTRLPKYNIAILLSYTTNELTQAFEIKNIEIGKYLDKTNNITEDM